MSASQASAIDSPTSLVLFIRDGLVAALGFRSPREQVVWSLIIGVGAIIASAVSFGTTLLIAIPALLILFPMGVVRVLLNRAAG